MEKTIIRYFSRLLLAIPLLACLIGTGLIIYLESQLPSIEKLKDFRLQVPLKIYTRDLKLMAEFGEKRRTPLAFADMPKDLINAVLATEDHRFYQHPGVDLRGLLRAFVSLVATGSKDQGGSTITMQVARNFFLTRKKTYHRKLNEILLALKIEQELSKEDILELYLNKIYLGKRAYGIAAAAEVYYGKTVDQLTLPQMAMLAGIPQAPTSINPLNSPKAAFKRRSHVLERMLTHQFIDQETFQEAVKTPLTATYHERPIEVDAPYVAEMVRQELLNRYGETIYDQGIEIITTVDSQLQDNANTATQRGLLEYDQRHGFRKPITKYIFHDNFTPEEELLNWQQQLQQIPTVHNLQPAVVTAIEDNKTWILLADSQHAQIPFANMKWAKRKLANPQDILDVGDVIYVQKTKNHYRLSQIPEAEVAFTALNPDTGGILALVGGFSFQRSSFNRASQAERQPGSSFKPFIYGAALENGFTTASIINDAPIVQEDPSLSHDWRPQNYTRKFYGPTRLRVGISKSRNLVSIRLLKALTIEKAINFLDRCGFNADTLPKGLSLALGTNHITPLQLATGYSIFPNGGYLVKPYLIEKIVDYQGNVIFHAMSYKEPVITPQTAYLVTNLLQGVVKSGTSRRVLQLGRKDLAGKTGTTSDHIDTWFSGFNRNIVATSWLGFDEPRSLKEYGVKAALPIWMYFMEKTLQDQPEANPSQPEGLITVRIDPTTGLLARAEQKDSIYEIFTEDTVPTQYAPLVADSTDNNTKSDLESLF